VASAAPAAETAEAAWSEQVLRALLDEHESVRLRVTGECMAPRLHHGDVVSLYSARRCRPRWADVVLVKTPAGLRLHRVVWAGRVWRTKGDRAPFWDGPVSAGEILAVAPENRHPLAALLSLGRAVVFGSVTRTARAVFP
jgi:hypothetical protein